MLPPGGRHRSRARAARRRPGHRGPQACRHLLPPLAGAMRSSSLPFALLGSARQLQWPSQHKIRLRQHQKRRNNRHPRIHVTDEFIDEPAGLLGKSEGRENRRYYAARGRCCYLRGCRSSRASGANPRRISLSPVSFSRLPLPPCGGFRSAVDRRGSKAVAVVRRRRKTHTRPRDPFQREGSTNEGRIPLGKHFPSEANSERFKGAGGET